MSGRNRALALAALLLAACGAPPPRAPIGWIELFDGASLAGWQSTAFGGEGDVAVRDGALHLGVGSPLTGVTWTGEAPHGDYELELTATRVEGFDFFCGLTFPVRDGRFLTLILGGWGGSVSGLSCLDGEDAGSNDTRTLRGFSNGVEHTVLLRVTDERVDVLLDGAPLLGASLVGRELSLRPEVELSRPLGVASFATEARIGRVRWRPLPKAAR